ncbi:hypothetical protein GCM10017783_00460 [Deinococcus piscis]|uniref:Bleomycin resistance protein n=1 Tax=Deinococcus piscis TaxID=394230 RepID=A0ABQ3JW24_9DEIO|nr:DinB family protein [Deinococcus piscis]GHF92588.1 hypothetical protein GCM10017783_00460 [Deinococcus piscis]
MSPHPADALATLLAAHLPALERLSEAQTSWRPAPDIWSAKEILGHLIDSAANNHARFVGGALAAGGNYAGYSQEGWVMVGGYQHRPWRELVELWATYQRQLIHLLRGVPDPAWAHALTVRGELLTLEELALGYVDHTGRHLHQLLRRCAEAPAAEPELSAADTHWNPLVPELTVQDFGRSLDFYTRLLGFGVRYRRTQPDFAYLDLHGAQVMLEAWHPDGWNVGGWNRDEGQPPLGRGINLQIEVQALDEVRERLWAAGVPLFRDVQEQWYSVADGGQEGARELLVQDPDGYLLRLSEPLGSRPSP